MYKFFIFIFIFFLKFNVSYSFEGIGPIKLDSEVIKYLKRYLNDKDGIGEYFFVSESGNGFGYSVCPKNFVDGCHANPSIAKKNCKMDVKEYLKNNEKCNMFVKKRYIVWNGNKLKVPKKASSSEIDKILKDINLEIEKMSTRSISAHGTGGMKTKIEAVKVCQN
tara:strand:+ start:336 stop:830 length:495 start_codon:yes stop_codon:yes gene_type:complete